MANLSTYIKDISNVENVSLSTWAGSTNLNTVGNITTGTWLANTIDVTHGGTGVATLTGLVKGNGTAAFSAAVAGTDYLTPSAGLVSIAGLVTAADEMIYLTAADTYATTILTAFARTLLDDLDAATMRTTLGLGTAATYSADTGITPSTVALRGASGELAAAALTLQTTGNASIEIGRIDGVASTPFIDFHSSSTANDYDVRLIVSGTSAVSGSGVLTIEASTVSINANVTSIGSYTSTVTTGTAPLTVSSTTLVTNLNADLLDGQQGSYYLDLTNAIGTLPVAQGGTGATTVAQAQTNLNVDPAGTAIAMAIALG